VARSGQIKMNYSAKTVLPSMLEGAPATRHDPDDEPAVVLRGVTKSYVRGNSISTVLDNVDFTVGHGECVFVVGPSGSGKTTLLSIIGCVLRADEGRVQILGQDVNDISPKQAAELRRHQIGFVFQRFHLIRGLTAGENVAVPLVLAGCKPAAATRRAAELLEQVDMAQYANSQPHRLSVGQCQRVAFARALVADPDLILADEPTAALDAKTGQQEMNLLRQLTVESGRTVVVVTHDPRILDFADRVVQIENGTLEEQRMDDDVMTTPVPRRTKELVAAY
jgi:putative ABC transport system ATP-binding protein